MSKFDELSGLVINDIYELRNRHDVEIIQVLIDCCSEWFSLLFRPLLCQLVGKQTHSFSLEKIKFKNNSAFSYNNREIKYIQMWNIFLIESVKTKFY